MQWQRTKKKSKIFNNKSKNKLSSIVIIVKNFKSKKCWKIGIYFLL